MKHNAIQFSDIKDRSALLPTDGRMMLLLLLAACKGGGGGGGEGPAVTPESMPGTASDAADQAPIVPSASVTVIGAGGVATISGTERDDYYVAERGYVTIFAQGGDDMIEASIRNDRIEGGAGNDFILGYFGVDVLLAGLGNDVIWTEGMDSSVEGGAGDDVIISASGNNELRGGSGDDILLSGYFSTDARDRDSLFGGGGDDILAYRNSEGGAILIGGAGRDHFYITNVPTTLQLSIIIKDYNPDEDSFTMPAEFVFDREDGVNTYFRFENGRDFDALIFENHAYDYGQDGLTEVMPKDPDSDGIIRPDRDAHRHNTLYGTDEVDHIQSGDGNDLIIANDGDDIVRGGTGNDYLFGNEGNDTIYGDSGNDSLVGNEGDDLIYGGIGNDFLAGGAGQDRLEGGAGNDRLYGDEGNDRLLGGEGNDALSGGEGADIMTGGAGADNFVFFEEPAVDEADRITDFQIGVDSLTFFAGYWPVEDFTLRQEGGNTSLYFKQDGTDYLVLTLENVAQGFALDDIIFLASEVA